MFGDNFGTYDTTTAKSVLEAHRGRQGVTDTEETLEERWGISTRIDPVLKVRLGARLQKQPGFRHYEWGTHGNVVGKGRTIFFRIAEITVPAPYDIYWKVRNTGEEAIVANEIRGQVVKDDDSRTRAEPTAFRGNHYVECYVVKNGVCVAKDRHLVIIK